MAFPGSQLTLVGNLTADPEMRFTPSGAGVANFTVAYTPRTFDRTSNEWTDGETLFLNCAVWRETAEHVAETLTRGMRVIVTGDLKARSYETTEGEKRTVWDLDVAAIGPELRFATAKVTKVTGGGGGKPPGISNDDPWGASGGEQRGRSGPQGGHDPWAQPSGGQDEEPPF